MRQSYRIIPVYTADVSGVCSALYELGGMTVMHDPSGCNSTYNTHDELRWYDQDSLIFISGLTEIDAVMGNDRKFINDITYTASELHPAFIALAGSPIPFLNGTDFPAIARIIEKKTGIPTFFVPTNGMHDYIYGAGIALEKIVSRFFKASNQQKKSDVSSRRVNLLGVTPLILDHRKR
ncbi:MAG: nitrogenase component 1 [Lachnospiraceae bacterium]